MVELYLPVERELVKLPKQWVINVIYAILGDIFMNWIHERCSERNAKIVAERKMTINVDSEIAAAFDASNHVSSK